MCLFRGTLCEVNKWHLYKLYVFQMVYCSSIQPYTSVWVIRKNLLCCQNTVAVSYKLITWLIQPRHLSATLIFHWGFSSSEQENVSGCGFSWHYVNCLLCSVSSGSDYWSESQGQHAITRHENNTFSVSTSQRLNASFQNSCNQYWLPREFVEIMECRMPPPAGATHGKCPPFAVPFWHH